MVPVGAIEVRSALRMPDLAMPSRKGLGQVANVAGGEVGLAVEQRERTLRLRQLDRGLVGGRLDRCHPFAGRRGGGLRAVAQAAHDERVGKSGHAEADAPLVQRFPALLLERKERDVDDIVHHAHGGRRGPRQRAGVEPRLGRERRSMKRVRLSEPSRQAP